MNMEIGVLPVRLMRPPGMELAASTTLPSTLNIMIPSMLVRRLEVCG